MDAEFWKVFHEDLARIKQESDLHLEKLDTMALWPQADLRAAGVYDVNGRKAYLGNGQLVAPKHFIDIEPVD